jgi:hypothetical protein
MKEAESLFLWLTTLPEGATVTSTNHHQHLPQMTNLAPPKKIFRNILDEDSIATAITVAISSDVGGVEHHLHPSHVPTPQTLYEFDLREVLPMTTFVLEDALGGIQQSLQNLLGTSSGKENSNQNKVKKPKHCPSPLETPQSTSAKKSTLVSLVDDMQPIRMGPEFWKIKATPQLLGDGSRHEREQFLAASTIPPPVSPTGSIRSVIGTSFNCKVSGSTEVTTVDFERFMDEMEARDDDTIMEGMTSNNGIQNIPLLSKDTPIDNHYSPRRRCQHLSTTAKTTLPSPLQRQWLNDHSLNLHQPCRPSIRWLDEDIVPVSRSLDAVGHSEY